jgi:hypothetical protein
VKGAFLVSSDPGAWPDASAALIEIGAVTYEEAVQLRDRQDRLFTMYLETDPEPQWEWREEPFVVRGDAKPPEMATASACWVECRREGVLTRIVRQLAEALSEPVWVLDGDGVLWPAADVDPRAVVL